MKVRLQCDEANHICDKNQYKEGTIWEMIKLNVHLIYCRACRSYTARNTKLTKAMKGAKPKTASVVDKNALKQQLQNELSK